MWTTVGYCPRCGAPIYAPAVWWSVLPPPVTYSCNCRYSGGPCAAPPVPPWGAGPPPQMPHTGDPLPYPGYTTCLVRTDALRAGSTSGPHPPERP